MNLKDMRTWNEHLGLQILGVCDYAGHVFYTEYILRFFGHPFVWRKKPEDGISLLPGNRMYSGKSSFLQQFYESKAKADSDVYKKMVFGKWGEDK